MKKILILGNSIAGACAIEDIRKNDKESEITLLCFEDNLPFERHLLADLLAKDTTEDKILFKPNSFYTDNKINIVTEKEIVKIDLRRNRVVFESKDFLSFDVLVITDMPKWRFPDIKGTNKTGVFHLKRLEDIKTITGLLPIIETVVIQSDEISGLKAAYAFNKRGKEVVFVVPSQSVLSRYLNPESANFFIKLLEEKGIRVILNSSINQILGDTDTKAIRLNTNKVLACQLVILDDVKPDLRLFQETLLECQESIQVDEFLRTKATNVFAVDRVAAVGAHAPIGDYGISTTLLKEEGRVVAANIVGQETSLVAPLPVVDFVFFDHAFSFIGETKPEGLIREYDSCLEADKRSTKLFIKENIICGAFLMNPLLSQKDKIRRLIEEKRNITGLEEQIVQEDVSFEQLLPVLASNSLLAEVSPMPSSDNGLSSISPDLNNPGPQPC